MIRTAIFATLSLFIVTATRPTLVRGTVEMACRRKRALCAMLLACSFGTGVSCASASPVQFAMSGTVTTWSHTPGSVFPSILPGTPFTGTFGYDTNPAVYDLTDSGSPAHYFDIAA